MTRIERAWRRLSNARIFSRGKYREIVVELSPPGQTVNLRLKGERTWHSLPLDHIYKQAVRATVEETKRLKREARKQNASKKT